MPVLLLEQSGPTSRGYFLAVGEIQRRDTAMITSSEYRQFARECIKWAAETKIDESRSALLDLACDWNFAALAIDRVEKQEACKAPKSTAARVG